MLTIDETGMAHTGQRSMQAAWAESPGRPAATSVVLQALRVVFFALALAGLVYGGFAAARTLPTGLGIALGWLLVSFVAAPLAGLVLKAATPDESTPVIPESQQAQAGSVPSGSTRA